MVVGYALSQGRRVALATATGVALGDFAAMTLSLAGLGALLAASAGLFEVLKWIGAGYLIYLGIRLWRSKPAFEAPVASLPARSGGRIFGHAFAVTALNPKSIAFFVAFVPQFVGGGAAVFPQLAIMEATFVGFAAVNALVFALAADQIRLRIRRPRVLEWLNRVGAGCLVAMGVATATRTQG